MGGSKPRKDKKKGMNKFKDGSPKTPDREVPVGGRATPLSPVSPPHPEDTPLELSQHGDIEEDGEDYDDGAGNSSIHGKPKKKGGFKNYVKKKMTQSSKKSSSSNIKNTTSPQTAISPVQKQLMSQSEDTSSFEDLDPPITELPTLQDYQNEPSFNFPSMLVSNTTPKLDLHIPGKESHDQQLSSPTDTLTPSSSAATPVATPTNTQQEIEALKAQLAQRDQQLAESKEQVRQLQAQETLKKETGSRQDISPEQVVLSFDEKTPSNPATPGQTPTNPHHPLEISQTSDSNSATPTATDTRPPLGESTTTETVSKSTSSSADDIPESFIDNSKAPHDGDGATPDVSGEDSAQKEGAMFYLQNYDSTTDVKTKLGDESEYERLQREHVDLIRRQSEAEDTIQRLRQESMEQIDRVRAESEEQRRQEIERILIEATNKCKKEMEKRLAEVKKDGEKNLKCTIENTTRQVAASNARTLKGTQQLNETLKTKLAERDKQLKELQDKLAQVKTESAEKARQMKKEFDREKEEQIKQHSHPPNLTDTQKVEQLEKQLEDTQQESERLRQESDQLREELDRLRKSIQTQDDQDREEAEQQATLERLRKNYLKVHGEKMELLEKLKSRDEELKQLCDQKASTSEAYLNVTRSLRADGSLSPGDDPKTEVVRLRQVVEEKDKKIESLEVQVRSFQTIASKREKLVGAKEQSRIVTELKRQLEKAKHEIAHFEGESLTWKQENDGAKDTIKRLEVVKLEDNRKLREANVELEDLRGHYDSLRRSNQRLNDQLSGFDRMKSQYEIFKEMATSLKEQVETIANKASTLTQEKEELLKQVQQLEDELEARKIVAIDIKGTLNDELKAIKEELHKITAERNRLLDVVEELYTEIEVRKLEAAQYKEDFERERKDREEAAGRYDQDKARWQVDSQKVADELRTQEELLKAEIDKLKVENLQKEERITELKKETDNQRKTFEEARDESTQHLAQLNKELEITKQAKAGFEQSAAHLSDQLDHLKEELQMMTGTNESLQTKVDEIDEDRQTKEKNLELTLHEKKGIEDSLERVQREVARLRQQLADTVKEKTVEVMGKNQQVKQIRKQVEEYRVELNNTRAELERVKGQYTETCIELDRVSGQLLQTQARVQEETQVTARLREDLQRSRTAVQEYQSQLQWHRGELQKKNQTSVDDELAPYRLHFQDPLPASRKVGTGCYGTVYAVEIDGIQCIAKRVQDILIPAQHYDVQGLQRRGIEEKFRQECILLSKIRHPNIVQFMGVRYGRDKYDLTLVMERLPIDLKKCLETYQVEKLFIPLSIRFSILVDVTYGLLHLHNRSILHRDLTAGNILLTSNLRAKIADLGVSRIVEARHSQELSKTPGTMGYMPPEALQDKPEYNLKLDIFSFGVLALFVALQEFPEFSWQNVPDVIVTKGESELYKRRQWMSKIGNQHFLYPLIHQCLQDDSKARPSTMELNTMMKELSGKFPRKLQDLNKVLIQLNKLGMIPL